MYFNLLRAVIYIVHVVCEVVNLPRFLHICMSLLLLILLSFGVVSSTILHYAYQHVHTLEKHINTNKARVYLDGVIHEFGTGPNLGKE